MRQHRLSFNPHTRQGIMAMIRSLQNSDSRSTSQVCLQTAAKPLRMLLRLALSQQNLNSPYAHLQGWLTVT